MKKSILFCDTCGKQKTLKGIGVPEGWYMRGYDSHFCCMLCVEVWERKNAKRKEHVPCNDPNQDDPGVGALYGRT